MKISKQYLKKIIEEELANFFESDDEAEREFKDHCRVGAKTKYGDGKIHGSGASMVCKYKNKKGENKELSFADWNSGKKSLETSGKGKQSVEGARVRRGEVPAEFGSARDQGTAPKDKK